MQAAMRRALEQLDVDGARAIWAEAFPNMPQPKSKKAALEMMHHARTQAKSMSKKIRLFSHEWLEERGLPSGLPDNMKPERPTIVAAVGVSVSGTSEIGRAVAPSIQKAMADAVADAYASGKTDPEFIKARMQEARQKAVKQLLGS